MSRVLSDELLSIAVDWAEQCAEGVCRSGIPLNSNGTLLARKLGVLHPEKVRVAFVEAIPVPDNVELAAFAEQVGLLSPHTVGLALGYSVLIRSDSNNLRLLSHELRHVFQYEQAGSIALFLRNYLPQLQQVGYLNSPLEIDARNHEVVS